VETKEVGETREEEDNDDEEEEEEEEEQWCGIKLCAGQMVV
jgi:hypothetical protein